MQDRKIILWIYIYNHDTAGIDECNLIEWESIWIRLD